MLFSSERLQSLLPPAVTCLGLAFTGVLLYQCVRFQRLERERQEDQALIQVSQAVQSSLAATSQILYGVVGLFDSSSPVRRQQFTTYHESLKLRDRSVAGIQGAGRRLDPAGPLRR